MSERWAVTGSNGFVGTALCERLRSRGVDLLRLQRARAADSWVPFELGGTLPVGALEGVEVLVHCAYDFRARLAPEIERINVQGSLRLLDAARQARARKLIFLSSASAYAGCLSLYGQAKLRVEQRTAELGGTVLRPGLVYADSPGGLAGTLEKLTGAHVLPVFSGGRQPLFLVHRDDLVRVIEHAAAAETPAQPLFVAHPAPVPFRDVLSLLGRRHARRVRFVSIPAGLALGALRAAERLGIRVGFRSDSLLGLLHPNPDPGIVPPFGEALRSFADWANGAPAAPA